MCRAVPGCSGSGEVCPVPAGSGEVCPVPAGVSGCQAVSACSGCGCCLWQRALDKASLQLLFLAVGSGMCVGRKLDPWDAIVMEMFVDTLRCRRWGYL